LIEILDTETLRANGMAGFGAYPNYEPWHWIWTHMKKLCVHTSKLPPVAKIAEV